MDSRTLRDWIPRKSNLHKGRRGFVYLVLWILLLSHLVQAGQGSQRRWSSFSYPPSFEHVSVESGLSRSSVHCILQDHRGFLWFGTDTGLNRYDGHRFEVFHPDPGNPHSISGEWILGLLEDRRGYLWIATRDGGLTVLDTTTGAMLPLPAGPDGAPAQTIDAIAEDPEGTIWVTSIMSGVFRISKDWRMPDKPRFQPFRTAPQGNSTFRERGVTSLFFDHRGTLWLGSLVWGLGRLDSKLDDPNPVFTYFPFDFQRPDTSSPFLIRVIREDAQGLLWLGSDNGPFTFDPDKKTFHRWRSVEGSAIDLGNERIYDILRDRADTMWIACDGAGLLKVLPRTGRGAPVRFRRFIHDAKDARSLSGNGIQCVYEDRSSVLWVSAYKAGLNKLPLHPDRSENREIPSLFQYRNIPASLTSLSGNTIASIGEDRFGNLWIGTDGSGLNRVRPPEKPGEPMTFERFQANPKGGPGALLSDVILTMHLDPQKTLWLGTYNGGLVRVDQTSATAAPRFTHYTNIPGDLGTPRSNFVRAIEDDGEGGFWLGFDGGGLNHFNPTTRKVRYYEWGNGPNRSSCESIFRIAKDGYGTLWMATPFGLNRFNPKTEEFRVYKRTEGPSISATFINTLHIEEGVLWIGTKGGGLVRMEIPPWDGPEPRFKAFGIREGLPAQTVLGIVPDHQHHLWLSTDRTICHFDIQEGRAHPLPWQHELSRAEFVWNACYGSSGGDIFFGSNDGLTLFCPQDFFINSAAPPIAITDFQIRNQSVPIASRTTRWPGPGEMQEITLGPRDSSFSFQFAALHFVAPSRNQYAYMLEGLDSTWNQAGNQHFVSYTTLPPRTYVLHVKAANADGVWGDQGLRLRIRVLPAWYKTWWFRILLVSCGTAMVIAIVAWYLQSLRRRNQYLERVMAEQAQRLHEAETLNAMTHLTESAAQALEDTPRWVQDMAQEVSKAVDAAHIEVWEVAEEHFLAITNTVDVPATNLQELELHLGADMQAIRGPGGELLAAMKIFGKSSPWTPLETELLASFSQHLASAYRFKWLRQSLAASRQQRLMDRKALAAQGQGVLQICPSCKRCYDEDVHACPEDGHALESPRLLPFRLLGRYRLQRLLGEGGTAHVFEAWDETLARSVAVKAIKPSNFMSEQARGRFAREASLLAQLEHPGIVSIFDSRELEDGTVFLVMERLKGRTVGRMLRQFGPARPGQVAFLLRQVASALASTHAKGLVHRDLKPENLFAVAGGEWIRYKVLDFGLAKGDLAETGFTQTGTLMGTPNYMSPEQARGRNVDWRSDLYSLAAILYEILTGKPVVGARVLAEIFVEVISREPVPLHVLMPGCPMEVETLLHQALTKNPRQRPGELLAWAGKLDVALQTWSTDSPGWPDRTEEDDPHSLDADQTPDLSAEQPPTL